MKRMAPGTQRAEKRRKRLNLLVVAVGRQQRGPRSLIDYGEWGYYMI